MILCECGESVDECKFRDYIETSANPSTPTIGHRKCGAIFNFIDGGVPKRYSSKTELKSLAAKFAARKSIDYRSIEMLLIETDRLKSEDKLDDYDILQKALHIVIPKRGGF